MLALAALARAVAIRGGRRIAGGTLRRGVIGGTAGGVLGSLIPGLGGDGDDDGKPARRRRRRVLTANDRADIAFITATLGASAGKSFSLIVAART